jgi:hydroxymethylpyrimidine/phosphomethylpyrimidine kinase
LDQRKYVASIAGFDPSAGAGVLTDIKCFEQHKVYGFGICSALTVQSDDNFINVQWLGTEEIIAQLEPLLSKFDITVCKIGLIQNISVLQEVIGYIRATKKNTKLVLDPVLKSSSGFEFHKWNTQEMTNVLKQIDLITPNYQEMLDMGNQQNVKQTAVQWAQHCPVLLKGGHNISALGTDLLFLNEQLVEFNPAAGQVYAKHGSGCVLSAAITSNLALGYSVEEACRVAKTYITDFLNSNYSLLGYHNHD